VIAGHAVRRASVRERLADWADLMHRHTPQSRQLLRKILHGRITATRRTPACFTRKASTSALAASVVSFNGLAAQY